MKAVDALCEVLGNSARKCIRLEARIAELEAENERMRKAEAPPVPDELTPKQIASACFSLRHDYGLLPERERDLLAYQCREWWRAISKELNEPSQHPMVLDATPEVPRG